MLSPQQVTFFNENGFLLVDSVFEPQQIDNLRQELAKMYRTLNLSKSKRPPRDTPNVKYDLFHRYAPLKWIVFHWPIVEMLKSLLGETYYTPLTNLSAQKSNYSGWHRDTDYWELINHYEHYLPNFLMLSVVLYLQDNDSTFGGGLDVIPGSHMERERSKSVPMEHPTDAYLAAHPPYTIPSKKGSLIFFDQRLRHKATTPTVGLADIPIEKMALFWIVATNNEHLAHYHLLMENLYGYQVPF